MTDGLSDDELHRAIEQMHREQELGLIEEGTPYLADWLAENGYATLLSAPAVAAALSKRYRMFRRRD